ncbi:GNAT family N-acetyltransferase [Shinella kummerowiae]|uniref:GNAT family N-acetyltransferase n=1 Tax=Shinella kummerowiae TaxID=417745 RepID=A0A6N8SMF5_9HYPH|nr:GNAT family N-acetyltransferase [Shinella kummerowiae]MXN48998.1 GNAT family N-acetyltransferase [Shinella kummerowiae]
MLPDFPARSVPSVIKAGGMELRHAASGDMAFLLALYRSVRAEEFAAVPWPPEQKTAFFDQQFTFQHRHYLAVFPEAHFLVVDCDGEPVGRLYLDCSTEQWHIIDIELLPEWRGRGMGSALLSAIQREATRAGATAVLLSVEQHNARAQALYRNLGFRVVQDGGSHIGMAWPCPGGPASEAG